MRQGFGTGGGPLGNLYDPFRLVYDATEEKTRIPGLQLPPGLTPERLADREKLLISFDSVKRTLDAQPLDDYRAQAFAMLTSPGAVKVFDLSNEPDKRGPRPFRRSGLVAASWSSRFGRSRRPSIATRGAIRPPTFYPHSSTPSWFASIAPRRRWSHGSPSRGSGPRTADGTR